MKVSINDIEYNYITNVRDHDLIRTSFIQLAYETFGLEFQFWYEQGYWGDNYIPYVLLEGNTVVANVSINRVNTIWQGQKKRFIQLGTVMTADSHRHKGLSRWLVDQVLSEWVEQCDALYLYANDHVLNFYPKFGFEQASEYQYSLNIMKKEQTTFSRKLDMSSEQDVQLLLQTYKQSNPYSALPMEDNTGLLMFYCSQFMKEYVYYVEQYDSIVIVDHDGERMVCYDIFSNGDCKLNEIIEAVATEQTKVVMFGFTPHQTDACQVDRLHEEGSTLFLLSDKDNLFRSNKLMFPLLSHA